MNWRAACALVVSAVISGCSDDTEPAPEVASLRMDPFVVEPGSQGLTCQTFANPFGRDVEVGAWSAAIARGGHHVLLFQVEDGEPGPAGECGANAGVDPILFQSQHAGTEELAYPEGVAVFLAADAKLMMQTHYLNAGAEPVTVDNSVELTAAAPGTVEAHVGSLLLQTFDIHVPPHDTATTSQSCTVGGDVALVWLTSHTHSHGVEFEAAIDDTRVYDSKTPGDPVVTLFEPPRAVSRGSSLRFDCTYANQGDVEVGFGPSLVDDEMCVLVGAYVAQGGGEPPKLECAIPPGDCLKCASAFAPGTSGELCTDDGPPSSAELVDAVKTCSCETGCAAECGASACAGQPPDDACFACMNATCGDEIAACFAG